MVRDNVLLIRKRIAALCAKLDRDPDSVIIVGVTKNRTFAQIQELLDAGVSEIGENRVQEAVLKYNAMANKPHISEAKWHMIGHLQTNKVRDAVGIFDLIHSVDSLRLAKEINKEAARISKVQDILIEVKTPEETTKFGVTPEATFSLVEEISVLKHISLKGLMTIAPLVDNPDKARPYFRQLRELREEVRNLGICDLGFGILSMGMSDDFEIAIEEGADMIRIGRAFFEG